MATRVFWNCGIRTQTPPASYGESQIMATLEAFTLLQAGVHTTQASVPHQGAANVDIHVICPDSVILDATPLVITALALEQSTDDGLTWAALAKVSWESDPDTVPHQVGDPLPRPGLSTTVPNDGKTRRFRARLDIPQALLAGLDVTIS